MSIILQMGINIENKGIYCNICPIPRIAAERLANTEKINGEIQGNGRLNCTKIGKNIEGEIEAEYLNRKGHVENHRSETIIRKVTLCHKIDRPAVVSKYIFYSKHK